MIKILTILGARPQFIKATALHREIEANWKDQIREVVVHTGQHYDTNMSEVFFEELEMPNPAYNLGIGSASHAKQTGAMLSALEEIILREKPDAVLVYGDTNSTLAGALVAAKLQIPLIHVEAGLRSFNKSMPEEINRIVCDHCSTLLFTPTKAGLKNLKREGIVNADQQNIQASSDHPRVYHCGDVMFDNTLHYSETAEKYIPWLNETGLEKGKYILATIHRENNTDNIERLQSILSAMRDLGAKENLQIAFPVHPRTSKMMELIPDMKFLKTIKNNKNIKLIPPASFLQMMLLEKHCVLVMTDSGGVQKEASFLKKPCITLRHETEWVELVESGVNILADADESKIKNAFDLFKNKNELNFPTVFGDGKAAKFICSKLVEVIAV